MRLISIFFVLLMGRGETLVFSPFSGQKSRRKVGNLVQPLARLSSRPVSAIRVARVSLVALCLSTRTEVELEKADTSSATSEVPDKLSFENVPGFSYGQFAKENPLANSVMIATVKSGLADLMAQTVISSNSLNEIDAKRSLLFCLFGCIYSGWFQYLYQVLIFKRLFDIEKFTQQSMSEKIRDGPGLRALAAQTGLDLVVLTLVYLPTFYIFKVGVFSGTLDPSAWFDTGLSNYKANFSKDELDLVRVWFPADVVSFSVPLYLRLPVRHAVSFVWTAYLSFARGGH